MQKIAQSTITKTLEGVFHAFKAHLSGHIDAEVTGKVVAATAEVIKALEPFDNGAIRIHRLLVVKITRRGKPMLRVETISDKFAAILADDPSLLGMPDELWTRLDAQARIAATPPSLPQTPEASTMLTPPKPPLQPPPRSLT